MKYIILVALFYVCELEAKLTCSLNGTHLFYVSNNNIFESKVAINSKRLNKLLLPIVQKIDEKKVVSIGSFSNIHYGDMNNRRNNFINGLREKKIKNPELLYEIFSNTTDEAINRIPIVNTLNKFMKGMEVVNEIDYFLAHESWLDAFNKLYIADMDDAQLNLMANLKEKIKRRLIQNKKVIMIPHGGGSFLLNEAIGKLRNDQDVGLGLDGARGKLSKFTGELRVASYSEVLTLDSSKTRIIKLTNDFPANSVGDTSNFENYTVTLRSTNSFLDFYLNPNVKAFPPGKTIYGAMSSLFAEEVVKVAESLENNCLPPVIKSFSNLIVSSNDGKNGLNVIAGPGKFAKITLKDVNTNYDNTKTSFSWAVKTLYKGVKTINDVEGTGDEVSINLPYNDFEYILNVTATNVNGDESVENFKFFVANDRAPTYEGPVQVCAYNDNLEYADGSSIARITLSDDSYALDKLVLTSIIPYRATDYLTSFGTQVAPIRITNTCARTPVNVEIWYRCQLQGCDRPEVVGDEGCKGEVNTGTQFNEARVYNPSVVGYETIDLGAGGYNDSSMGEFSDPNEPGQMIEFPKGGMCMPNEESDGGWVQM